MTKRLELWKMNTKNTKSTWKVKKSHTQEPYSEKKEKWIRLRRADLMSKSSEAERIAYKVIGALGYKVIRQFPINTGRRIYFADLYLPELKLVFELDGGYHYTDKQKRLDNNRSSGIWRLGYHVVRLSNHDARNSEKIKAKIKLILKKLFKES